MEQAVLGLPIKASNSNVIQSPLVATANKAASDRVRYAAGFGKMPSARARLAVDGGSAASNNYWAAGIVTAAEPRPRSGRCNSTSRVSGPIRAPTIINSTAIMMSTIGVIRYGIKCASHNR